MGIKNIISKKKLPVGIVAAVSVLAVGIVGFMTYQYYTVKAWSNLIYPGVKIEGENLGGKNKEQAKQIISQKYGAVVIKNKLNIVANDRTYTLDYSKLNPKYNIDEVVNEAASYGKELNIFKKFNLVKGSEVKEFKLKVTYDSKPIDEITDTIEKEVNKEAVNATLSGSGGNFTVVPEVKGTKLQKEALKKEILAKLDGAVASDVNIKAPIETVGARITSDKLSSISYRVSSYSTNYGSISSRERANNIILATRSINGKILLPGDEFSFNDVVGERTAEKGYRSAPVIIGNQVDSGLGGGICQVSTTLYNAILRANIKSVERSHHSLPSHYVPLGMDATVDYGNLDYKFKNTLEYPLYIEADASGGTVVFNIYSNKALASTVAEIHAQVYQTIQPNIKYIDEPTLKVGQTEQIQAPSTGYKVKVTSTTTKDGVVISEDLIADDFYQPVEGIVKRGTKKEEPKKEEPKKEEPKKEQAKSNAKKS